MSDALQIISGLPGRIADKIYVAPDGCWLWMGYRSVLNYGGVRWDGRSQRAHRVVYQLIKGPISKGLTLDHRCRNPPCVNPDHLLPMSLWENTRLGNAPTSLNARKTHCIHGHDLTDAKVVIRDGTPRRKCRTCSRIRSNEHYARVRAARKLSANGEAAG